MKKLLLLTLLSAFSYNVFAQVSDSTQTALGDSTMTTPTAADSAIANEQTMQDFGLVSLDDYEGVTIGFTSIEGPKFIAMANDTATEARPEYVAAIRSGVVVLDGIRVAEIKQSRLDSALREISRGDQAIVARQNGNAQFGVFGQVDYVITQNWDYDSWIAGFSAMDLPEDAKTGLNINSNAGGYSDQFMLMEMTSLKDGSKIYFALAPDGFLQSARTYSQQFNNVLEQLVKEDNPSNRAKLAAAHTFKNMENSFSNQFMFQLRVFMLTSAGTAAHALIQGPIITKAIMGGAGGFLAYYLRGWIGTIGKEKRRYGDLAESTLAAYNSASGQSIEFAFTPNNKSGRFKTSKF